LGLHCVRTLPFAHIQRREQRRRTVPDVIVGDALDVAETHRQDRLSALERLALALLVDAQHQRVIRRFRYNPTMSRTFSMKNGSLESLKLFERCGCGPRHRQVAVHRALREPGLLGQAPARTSASCRAALRVRAVLISAAISSSPVLRGRPGFSSLCSPAMPCSA
jgi:hypothetical protein